MPNLDGGHYFYTGLFPVQLDSVQRPDGSYTTHSHLLREARISHDISLFEARCKVTRPIMTQVVAAM